MILTRPHIMYVLGSLMKSITYTPIPLDGDAAALMAIMALLQIAVEAPTYDTFWNFCVSTTIPVRFYCDVAAMVTLMLRYCCSSVALWVSSWRFYYAFATTKEIRLRLVYAIGDVVAMLLRPRRGSCAAVALLDDFCIKLTIKTEKQQLNTHRLRVWIV